MNRHWFLHLWDYAKGCDEALWPYWLGWDGWIRNNSILPRWIRRNR